MKTACAAVARLCRSDAERLLVYEHLSTGHDVIQQYLDDNSVYAATLAGLRAAWESLRDTGNSIGTTLRRGPGKIEFYSSFAPGARPPGT